MATILYTNFALFDGTGKEFVNNSWLLTDTATGRIIQTGTGDQPFADETIVLHGKYVMPAMVNSHVHIVNKVFPYAPKTPLEPFEYADQSLKNLNELFHSGVTYTRALGTAHDYDIGLQRLSEKGALDDTTKLIAAGRAFTTTGGHGSKAGQEVDGPEEMRKGVRERLKAGAGAIKYMASGGIAFAPKEQPWEFQMSEVEMRAGIIEAHKKGIKVAVHEQPLDGVKAALRARADSIEHAFEMDNEALELFHATGAYLTPTLIAPYVIIKRGDGILPQWMVDKSYEWVEKHFNSFGMAARDGVKIALGTDAGSPLNGFGDTALEAELMTMAGATNLQVLRAATKNSADLLDITADYGTLEVGKFANFMVLDANPLHDIKTLQAPNEIVHTGKIVTTPYHNDFADLYPLDKGHLGF